MSPTVTLKTFFRATDDGAADALGPASYVAGFEAQDSGPGGVTVPLGSEEVESVVMSGTQFSILIRSDGTLMIEADGLSDAVIEQISSQGSPTPAAIDELVRETLRPDLLAMEDDPKAELQKLQDRLKAALGLVREVLQNFD